MDSRGFFILCLLALLAAGDDGNGRRRLRIRRRNDTTTQTSARLKTPAKTSPSASLFSSRLSLPENKGKKLVCYYTNWSQYRPKIGKFLPEDIPADLCTHLIFAFGWMKKGKLSSFESNDESKDGKVGLYEKINILKKVNPKLKTLLAIGGWSFGTQKFKDMSSTRYSRQLFVLSSIPYLRERNFDGLDIDWEYPKGSEDKANYVLLLKELHEAFEAEAEESGKPMLLLSAAVPVGPDSIRGGYDVPAVSKYLDFINLMAYDFHGKWESQTGHNAPLYAPSSDSEWRKQLSVSHAALMWTRLGAPKDKLVIGMPTYGRSFTLADSKNFSVNVATKGGGVAGVYTRESGFLAYYEVCEILRSGKAHYIWDEEMKVPYVVDGDQWIGFDDERSIKNKMDWVNENGFAGAMVWTVDMDDFRGDVCGGKAKYPLIKIMREEMTGVKRDGQAVDWTKYSKKLQKISKPEPIVISIDEVLKKKINKPTTIQTELTEEDNTSSQAGALSCVVNEALLSKQKNGNKAFLDPSVCTAIVLVGPHLKEQKLNTDVYKGTLERISQWKETNPRVQVLLGLEADSSVRELTNSIYRMNNFVYESVEFLRENGFDGFELTFKPNERSLQGFETLLRELRLAFEGEAKSSKLTRLILSARFNAPASYSAKTSEIAKYVDFLGVPGYGFTSGTLSHHSALRSIAEDGDSVENFVTKVLEDVPPQKLQLGLSSFGKTYTLADSLKFDIGAAFVGTGNIKSGVLPTGSLAYFEVCEFLDHPNTTLVWDNEQSVPFAYNDNQWVGFDDARSMEDKIKWAQEHELGGVFLDNVNLDDFDGNHCASGTFPLLKAVQKSMKGYRVNTYDPELPGLTPINGSSKKTKNNPQDIVCAEEDGHISYHKDQADCTKYYMCEGERKHHMPCPAQLVFNPNENVCDWPENVEGCMTISPN